MCSCGSVPAALARRTRWFHRAFHTCAVFTVTCGERLPDTADVPPGFRQFALHVVIIHIHMAARLERSAGRFHAALLLLGSGKLIETVGAKSNEVKAARPVVVGHVRLSELDPAPHILRQAADLALGACQHRPGLVDPDDLVPILSQRDKNATRAAKRLQYSQTAPVSPIRLLMKSTSSV